MFSNIIEICKNRAGGVLDMLGPEQVSGGAACVLCVAPGEAVVSWKDYLCRTLVTSWSLAHSQHYRPLSDGKKS